MLEAENFVEKSTKLSNISDVENFESPKMGIFV